MHFVSLYAGQGSVTAPGCLAAVPVEAPLDPEEGAAALDMPLVLFYGHATPSDNPELYKVDALMIKGNPLTKVYATVCLQCSCIGARQDLRVQSPSSRDPAVCCPSDPPGLLFAATSYAGSHSACSNAAYHHPACIVHSSSAPGAHTGMLVRGRAVDLGQGGNFIAHPFPGGNGGSDVFLLYKAPGGFHVSAFSHFRVLLHSEPCLDVALICLLMVSTQSNAVQPWHFIGKA